ncbi:MAG: hypothetical protein KC486_32700, partial [Myxococcales bacterium]|nr:hypothetical protein [Myxococcales bacterium]
MAKETVASWRRRRIAGRRVPAYYDTSPRRSVRRRVRVKEPVPKSGAWSRAAIIGALGFADAP